MYSCETLTSDPAGIDCAEDLEKELVVAAKLGDSQAFVRLSTRHISRLTCRINRITKNREETEDVLQEAILNAFVHLDTFKGNSAFGTWFTRIAVNSALMRLRRRRFLIISLDEEYGDAQTTTRRIEPPDGRNTPEEQLVQQEKEELLRAAMLRLNPRLRAVVELHIRGFCGRDIAGTLGISTAAAKSRLTRGRDRLRELIG